MKSTNVNPNVDGKIPGYSKTFRLVEISSLIAFTVLYVLMLRRFWNETESYPVVMAAAFLLGMLGADFMSGMVHWFADTWGTSQWFLVGPTLIRSFREHHVDQAAICHHDFVEANGATALVTLPVLTFCYFIWPSELTMFSTFLLSFAMSFCFWTLMTNQVHKWAHSITVPWYVAILMRSHIVLSKEKHAVHHVKPHEKSYCITTGWMNPVLNKTGFFRKAETVITALTGMIPREDDLRLVEAIVGNAKPAVTMTKSATAEVSSHKTHTNVVNQ